MPLPLPSISHPLLFTLTPPPLVCLPYRCRLSLPTFFLLLASPQGGRDPLGAVGATPQFFEAVERAISIRSEADCADRLLSLQSDRLVAISFYRDLVASRRTHEIFILVGSGLREGISTTTRRPRC